MYLTPLIPRVFARRHGAEYMTQNLPEKRQPTELAADTTVFSNYLEKFGLPTDNIIATTEERRVVGSNLPHFLESLPPEEKRAARYLRYS